MSDRRAFPPRSPFRAAHARFRPFGAPPVAAALAAVASLVIVTALAPLSMAGVGANVKLNTDGTSEIHNEEQIAVNPTDFDNVVAVWRDFRLGYRRVGVGVSHDGGVSWTDTLLSDVDYPRHSDPGICADNAGTFYAHTLALSNSSPTLAGVAIQVFKSTDGGNTWLPPVDVVQSQFGLLDKQMIACDRSTGPGQGAVHLAWYDVSQGIRTARSSNGAASFQQARQVSDGGSVQWPVPAVGPDSQLYMGWLSLSTSELRFDRSSDGGRTWGTDQSITPLLITNEPLNGGVDVLSYPAMMADVTSGPHRGTIYVAYLDRSAPGADADIFLRKSTDEGDTWTAPLRVNDDAPGNGADQFHPWIVVDELGIVNVIWMDRRDDASNLDWHIYIARSFDGGETFTPNVRVSEAASSPTGGQTIAAGLIGEYIGIDAQGGDLHTVWTDTRDGQQDVWAAPVVNLDSDGDGFADLADNCPALSNRLQRDGDADGTGNECDGDADGDGLSNDIDGDDDNDGVLDGSDCAPFDALVFAVPGEASGLLMDPDRVSVVWNADPTGASTSYRLDRGTIPASGFDDYDHDCLAGGLFDPQATDPSEPPPGEASYYLGILENCFGPGPAGTGEFGARPDGAPCP